MVTWSDVEESGEHMATGSYEGRLFTLWWTGNRKGEEEGEEQRNMIQPSWPGVVALAFHLSTLEAGAGGSL